MKRSLPFAFLPLLLLSLSPRLDAAGGETADRAYLKGLVQERFGKPEDALSFYRDAARLDPSSRFLQESLAGLCVRLNRLDEALGAARRAQALSGADPSTRVLVGRVLLAQGDREAAGKAFDEALRLDPADGEALLYAAYARAAADPRGAIGFMERYLRDNPDSPEALIRIAELQEAAKDPAAAEAAWRRAAEKDPSNPAVQTALGRLAVARGDRAAALAAYQAALFLDPHNPEILIPLGETYHRLGRADEARETFERLVLLRPTDAAAHFGLALLAEDRLDWTQAARHMAVAAAGSDEPGVPLRLAFYQSMAGRAKDALKTLASVRRKDPTNVSALVYMGLAHEDLGNHRRALKWFRKALDLSPGRADAHFHAAVNWEALGRFDRAEPHLRRVLAGDPANAPALNYLGYSLADRNDRLPEALALIRRALAVEPENGAFLDSLGWCLFKMGNLPEAEASLARAVEREDDPLVWDHYGAVMKASGKPFAPPKAVLRGVAENFRRLKGLAGSFSVVGKERSRAYGVDGVLYYAKPGLFRLEFLGAFLAPQALIVRNGDGIHAAPSDGALPSFPQGDAWFKTWGDFLSGDLARRFDVPDVRVESREGRLTYRADFGALGVDGRSREITDVTGPGFAFRFGDYTDVDGIRLPATVRMELPGGTLSLAFSFRKIRVNPGLEPGLFNTPK